MVSSVKPIITQAGVFDINLKLESNSPHIAEKLKLGQQQHLGLQPEQMVHGAEKVINNENVLNQLLSQTNKQLADKNIPINFMISKDKETGQNIVKLIDSKTNEIIRQIPPNEQLELAKAIDLFLSQQKMGFMDRVV